MTFDIEHVVKNATNVEKWMLLSGQTAEIVDGCLLTIHRSRLLAHSRARTL